MHTSVVMFYKKAKIFNQINRMKAYVYFLHGKNKQSRIYSQKILTMF